MSRTHTLLNKLQSCLGIRLANHISETMISSNIKAMRNSLKFNINIRSETTTSCRTCDPTSKSVSQKITKAGWPWIANGATINIDLYYVLWGKRMMMM
ncbi:hypothetical protein QL285_095886 [Trifolium repens]|nr:hypothetical protein QL285_095886 [Trifolium repens]